MKFFKLFNDIWKFYRSFRENLGKNFETFRNLKENSTENWFLPIFPPILQDLWHFIQLWKMTPFSSIIFQFRGELTLPERAPLLFQNLNFTSKNSRIYWIIEEFASKKHSLAPLNASMHPIFFSPLTPMELAWILNSRFRQYSDVILDLDLLIQLMHTSLMKLKRSTAVCIDS